MCTRKSICMIQNRVLYHGQVRSGSIQFCCYRLKTILKSQDFWTFVADWILVWVTLFLMLLSCWLYFNRLETVTNNQMPEPILEPKFTELVVFGYTTGFKCQQPKTKTEKNKIGCRYYFSLIVKHCKRKQPIFHTFFRLRFYILTKNKLLKTFDFFVLWKSHNREFAVQNQNRVRNNRLTLDHVRLELDRVGYKTVGFSKPIVLETSCYVSYS